jgi:hypothetical protein
MCPHLHTAEDILYSVPLDSNRSNHYRENLRSHEEGGTQFLNIPPKKNMN